MRIDQLARRFPEPIRRRGAACQRAGIVTIKHHSPTVIRAVAVGTRDYDIRIESEQRTLALSCSCPYFQNDGPCKHLWATALVADQRKWLADLPEWTKVRLEGVDLDEDDQDEDEDDDDDEDKGEDKIEAGEDGADDVDAADQDGDPRVSLIRPAFPPRRNDPDWKTLFVGEGARDPGRSPPAMSSAPALLLYVIEIEKTHEQGDLAMSVRTRVPKKTGGFTKDKPAAVPLRALDSLSDERDRRALPLFQAAAAMGGTGGSSYYGYGYGYGSTYGQPVFSTEARIPAAFAGDLMPLVSATGRLFVRASLKTEPLPAIYDGDRPWDFVLSLRRRADGSGGEVSGSLRRDGETVALSAPLVITASGWVVFERTVGRVRHFGAFGLLGTLRSRAAIPVAPADEEAFLQSLYDLPALPRLELPDDLALRELTTAPVPVLKIGPPEQRAYWARSSLRPVAALSFFYDDLLVPAGDPRGAVARVAEGRLLRRAPAAELAAAGKVLQAGFQRAPTYGAGSADPGRFDIASAKLSSAVRLLVGEGWRVEADGKLYRRPGRFDLSVTSGVDWFDLQATIDFDGVVVSLPDLLRALRRGDRTIALGDGSFGMMPEEWLKRYGLLVDLDAGVVEGESLRFRPTQVGLLDALLAAEPEVSVDALFTKARDSLRGFSGIEGEKAPRQFRGELRPYQEVGLGWLSFLRRFGFGGCLADDMGLGKTVQILAMLVGRPRAPGRPSLVVVPKSLVWNWQEEAARFAPKLRLLAHVGPERAGDAAAFRRAIAGVDVVLTTYGLLRKDVPFLREIEMDYLILDEAQAIKNADSESAKAARLLRGQHRLALSGTPIENHVGELWSLIEFLNPGMLGRARSFAGATGTKRADPETVALLAKAVRPFVLRRTKEQVAPELPPKHEETILCEMEPEQRRLYDELREHYRATLLGKIAKDGIGKSKLQVLEALLRLRQAACHPGLIDKKRVKDGSGKMEVLFARLDELRAEGHKALVFSQFTSFLALVRARLTAEKIPYEYLDGDTRDRQACVTRFQTDADCPLFLISLKAGGVGLNLTAADYVFILDPWWNPAVEAQAVDRAHRIGQDKHVFVYRLLCRNSVEEKVAALQEEKRDLAASIINADGGSVIQKLDRETLEELLA